MCAAWEYRIDLPEKTQLPEPAAAARAVRACDVVRVDEAATLAGKLNSAGSASAFFAGSQSNSY